MSLPLNIHEVLRGRPVEWERLEFKRRWTDKRSLAITGALQGWKQDRIASLWDKPIKQQSVVDNLNGADWKSIEKAISFFEKSLPKQSNS